MRFCLTLLLTPLFICVVRAAESTATNPPAAGESPVHTTNDVLWKRQTPSAPNPLAAFLPAGFPPPASAPGENPDTDAFVDGSDVDLIGTTTTTNPGAGPSERRDLGWSDFIAQYQKPDQTLSQLDKTIPHHVNDRPASPSTRLPGAGSNSESELPRVHTAPVDAVAEAANAKKQSGTQPVDEMGDRLFDEMNLKPEEGDAHDESSVNGFRIDNPMSAIADSNSKFPVQSGDGASRVMGMGMGTMKATGKANTKDSEQEPEGESVNGMSKEWRDSAAVSEAAGDWSSSESESVPSMSMVHGGEASGMPATWSRLFGARRGPPAF